MYESELWSHDRIYMDLDGTRKVGDVKKALVKCSDAHYWKTESKQMSTAENELRAPKEKLVELS